MKKIKEKMTILHLLAFSVGDVSIEPPKGVAHLTEDKVGFLGGNIIQLFINLLLLFTVLLSFFFLIWGGVSWILSGGDKEGVEHAKQKITYAIIGLVLAFVSFAIINIIGTFFSVELFQK